MEISNHSGVSPHNDRLLSRQAVVAKRLSGVGLQPAPGRCQRRLRTEQGHLQEPADHYGSVQRTCIAEACSGYCYLRFQRRFIDVLKTLLIAKTVSG